jgi:hypothetical protein
MDLPPEIRHEIYFLATPDRVVHVQHSYPQFDNYNTKGPFSCSALIPPLLHMCSESRDLLTKTGYKLVFRDQTTGRRFWFNFKRDTLFIDRGALFKIYEGINPFPCRDTQRVHRIGYERGDLGLHEHGIKFVLQNFGELQEVFLIEWTGRAIETRKEYRKPGFKSGSQYFRDVIPQRHSYDTRNLCKFVEIQKIDGHLCFIRRFDNFYIRSPQSWWPGRWWNSLGLLPPATLPKDTDLVKYFSEPYEKWESVDHPRKHLEASFATYWAELGLPSEKLPKIKPVHLLTDAEHQAIQRERRTGFRILQIKFHLKKYCGLTENNHVRLIRKRY